MMRKLFVIFAITLMLLTSLIPTVQSAPNFVLIDTFDSGGAYWTIVRNQSAPNMYWEAQGDRLKVLTVTNGVFADITSYNTNATYYDVDTDYLYAYVALGAEGIGVFGYDAGTITFLTSIPGVTCYNLWVDDITKTVHCALGNDGLKAYWYNSVLNALQLQDSDDQGGLYYAINASDDGQYIFVSSGANILYYTFVANTYTYVSQDTPGDNIFDVYTNNTYMYVATDNLGIAAYTYDGLGLNFKDIIDNYATANYRALATDNSYLYAGLWNDGIGAYTFDGTNLVGITRQDDGSTYQGLTTDSGGYIYASCSADGIRSYLFGNFLTVTTNASSAVTETTATIAGYLTFSTNSSTKVNFSYSATSGATGNWTTSANVPQGTSFTGALSYLNPGYLFWYKASAFDGTNYANGSTLRFLTKPFAPLFFSAVPVNDTVINISWQNASVGPLVNLTVDIFISTTGFLAAKDFSKFLTTQPVNQWYLATGLNRATKYYFTAWSNISAMGLFQNSSAYATSSATTVGGDYNITLLWENNGTAVGDTHFLDNTTCVFRLQNGQLINTTSNLTYYRFTMNANTTPEVCYLFMNQTLYYRALTITPGVTNLTFYLSPRIISTSAGPFNYSEFQQPYTFSFYDETANQIFRDNPSTQFFVYKFNDTLHNDLTPWNIVCNYLDASRQLTVPLEIGKYYYCGILNSDFYISNLSYFQATLTPSITIQIMQSLITINTSYDINDIVYLNITNDQNGIWFNYTDSSYTTHDATMFISNMTVEGIKTSVENFSFFVNNINHQFVTSDFNTTYYVQLVINSTLFSSNQTIIEVYHPTYYTFPYSEDWVNFLIQTAFGRSPLDDGSGNGPSWNAIFVAALFIFCITTFGLSFTDLGIIFSSVIIIAFAGLFMISLITGVYLIAGISITFAIISLIRRLRYEL